VVEDAQVELLILVMEKNHLAMIASLDNMMWSTGDNNSGYPTHCIIFDVTQGNKSHFFQFEF